MFWKTMAILWTVLLLILAGAVVQCVLTAQPGSSEDQISSKGPARGTQATAFLTGVPPECPVIPAMLDLKGERVAGKSGAVKLPKDLQNKSLEDLQRRLVVRRLTGNMVAIDVSGCKSDKQARELARAAADSYIRFVSKSEANMSEGTIRRLTAERDILQNRLNAIGRQMATVRGGTSSMSMIQEKQKSLSRRLEILDREILEAERELSQAESALKVHEEMQKKGSLANSPDVRLAVETDPILQTLRILLVEVKAGLQALPPNRDKKTAIAVLQNEFKARRKEVSESQIKTIGLERQMSPVTATARLMDLKDREDRTKAEARDAIRALSTIDSLESERKQLEESIIMIEQRLMDVQMELLKGVPELIGILP